VILLDTDHLTVLKSSFSHDQSARFREGSGAEVRALARIANWCAAPDMAGVDRAAFLDAWNFLNDLAGLRDGADTPYTRLSRGAAECYDKLFWGCNLSGVTPPSERFESAWQADELIAIHRVMEAGLELFESEQRAADVRA